MLDKKKQYIIPLVLHGIVQDGKRVQFEDVELSIFREILNYCSNRCIDFNERLILSHSSLPTYLLTFDDGIASDALLALPLLVEKKCPSIHFVISEKIGTKGYLTTNHLREMVACGQTVGSHSISHPDFTLLSEKEQLNEFIGSKEIIEDFIGMPVRDFSFPYGRYNQKSIDLGFRAGFERIFTSKHGTINQNSNIIPRNSVNGNMSLNRVRTTLEASLSTRFSWIAEDLIKTALIDSIGPTLYVKIRRLIVGG